MQACVSLLSATVGYCALAFYEMEVLNSLLFPSFLIFVLAWFISTQFKEIYGMTILTLLYCFFADQETNRGARYATEDFKSFMRDFKTGPGHGERQPLNSN